MHATVIERLEASFAGMAPRAPELVDRFCTLLFARYPQVRPLFPQDMSAQKSKLIAALRLTIRSLRTPGALRQALLELGQRHARYGAEPEHYPLVRDTLLEVMEEISGATWSAQHAEDWTAALNFVASVMIEGQRSAQTSGI